MYTTQKGFTLIELVVVIVLLGILGVTALGKFQDLSGEAATAANTGIAAELSSAAAINYAVSAGGGTPDVTVGSATDDCTEAQLQGLFQTDTFPTGHGVAAGAGVCASAGDTFTCTVSDDDGAGTAATATIICTTT